MRNSSICLPLSIQNMEFPTECVDIVSVNYIFNNNDTTMFPDYINNTRDDNQQLLENIVGFSINNDTSKITIGKGKTVLKQLNLLQNVKLKLR